MNRSVILTCSSPQPTSLHNILIQHIKKYLCFQNNVINSVYTVILHFCTWYSSLIQEHNCSDILAMGEPDLQCSCELYKQERGFRHHTLVSINLLETFFLFDARCQLNRITVLICAYSAISSNKNFKNKFKYISSVMLNLFQRYLHLHDNSNICAIF